MIVWLAATLWLFSAALAAELPKEHLPHHYSYYPCLPREPELHLTSAVGLLVPPSGPRFVERKFPAVAERTLMLHLYMLATGSPMRRLLWLFNRSWGALSNGTVLTVVWKDNEDLVHADRELNITGLDLIERWNHLTFRFWEKEGQVAVNGETVMRIFDLRPWVDFTGFFLGHTPTVANPNPVHTDCFFADVSYFNYIVSDDEMRAHMQRAKSSLLDHLPKISSKNALFWTGRINVTAIDEWPISEAKRNEVVEYWKTIGRDIVLPPVVSVAMNASHFLFYPCLPRSLNSSLTEFRVQPVHDGGVDAVASVPLVGEYSVAFHVATPKPIFDWTQLFGVECSWALFTDGSAIKVTWEDSTAEPSGRFATAEKVWPRFGTVSQWTHVAARVWQESIDVFINGKFAQRALGSPRVNRCGIVLGGREKNGLRGAVYLASYWNHIISDAELDHHLHSAAPSVPVTLDWSRLVAGDELKEGQKWWQFVAWTAAAGMALLVAASFVTEWPMGRGKKAPSGEEGPCRLCLEREKKEKEKERDGDGTEEDKREEGAGGGGGGGTDEEKRLRKQRKKMEAKRKREEAALAEKAEKKRLERLEEELSLRVRELKQQLQLAGDEKNVYREMTREAQHKLAKATADRNANDRDAQHWRNFVEDLKRKEQVARENLEAPMREMTQVLKERGAKAFLVVLYRLFPPKYGSRSPPGDEVEWEKVVRQTLLSYHPDKQDVQLHGIEWCQACMQITALLNGLRK